MISPKYPRNIPEISPKYRGYYGFGLDAAAATAHAKACVSRNCDTNARIKFLFDDLEWKNPIDFGENRKNQNGHWPPAAILWKYDEKACALLWFHHLIKNAPINFIFDVATDLL